MNLNMEPGPPVGAKEAIENNNAAVPNQIAECLYEMLVFGKEGKVIKSIILTACERDRIPRRRNENETEVIETNS